MPTLDDVKRAPPGYHWHPLSPQAQEERERELALFEKYEEFYKRHHAEATAPASADPRPETSAASDEHGAS